MFTSMWKAAGGESGRKASAIAKKSVSISGRVDAVSQSSDVSPHVSEIRLHAVSPAGSRFRYITSSCAAVGSVGIAATDAAAAATAA